MSLPSLSPLHFFSTRVVTLPPGAYSCEVALPCDLLLYLETSSSVASDGQDCIPKPFPEYSLLFLVKKPLIALLDPVFIFSAFPTPIFHKDTSPPSLIFHQLGSYFTTCKSLSPNLFFIISASSFAKEYPKSGLSFQTGLPLCIFRL